MKKLLYLVICLLGTMPAMASEVSIVIPELYQNYDVLGVILNGYNVLEIGIILCIIGLLFAFMLFAKVKRLPVHLSMIKISEVIYQNCKTYLKQQTKALLLLEIILGGILFYYFHHLQELSLSITSLIILCSAIGMLGVLFIAWFGAKINNYANSRTAFGAFEKSVFTVISIPLRAGISVSILLVCIELIILMSILLFAPADYISYCLFAFALGEALSAIIIRTSGGIFSKIADISSDLMKIIFKIKENDARNSGVIADCTGDNVGDVMGSSADTFETYGITSIALIIFIILTVGWQINPEDNSKFFIGDGTDYQAKFIIWVFAIRIVMMLSSIVSYTVNHQAMKIYSKTQEFHNFAIPLNALIWSSSFISIGLIFFISYFTMAGVIGELWINLSLITSCGTLAAVIIPELAKIFTSEKSRHVTEIVKSSHEGGAILLLLSGIVAGSFSAFWKGIMLITLIIGSYYAVLGLEEYMLYPSIFGFGLLAFGMLGVGPVTVAGYSSVADSAQSIFELSQIETIPHIQKELQDNFSVDADCERAKLLLEKSNTTGSIFKSNTKSLLTISAIIAVITMIFSMSLILNINLEILDIEVLLGLLFGGAIISWLSGALIQSVVSGTNKAIYFIKNNIELNSENIEDTVKNSKEVIKICNNYSIKGAIHILGAIISFTIAFAYLSPVMFASYLISLVIFGLYQSLFMAGAGGAWDRAKKIIELDLRKNGSKMHTASIIGDAIGDAYKDTVAITINSILQFISLFGLLILSISLSYSIKNCYISIIFLMISLIFVWKSFYNNRIKHNLN